MAIYYVGDAVTLDTSTTPFATAAAPTVPADPTTVILTVTDPAGTATTYTHSLGELTRTSAGVYARTVTCSTAGRWHAKIVGTGAVARTATIDWDVETP